KQKNILIPILIGLTILICPILIIWLYSFVLCNVFNLPMTDINTILGGVIGAVITSVVTIVIARKKL
ncbi:MAG: hypothetical protein LBB85_09615, partial [Dysgonamonadaceae bacterium]|nr:hypothetical protein [Dysgonamonadaceae bacterium]